MNIYIWHGFFKIHLAAGDVPDFSLSFSVEIEKNCLCLSVKDILSVICGYNYLEHVLHLQTVSELNGYSLGQLVMVALGILKSIVRENQLILSWRRPLSYRTLLLRKLMDWFLYDNGLRHEKVKKKKKAQLRSIIKYIASKNVIRFVTRRCSVKKAFLKTLQNSQKNTSVRDYFLIKLPASNLQFYLKRISGAGVFLWILWNFKEHLFFIEHLCWAASVVSCWQIPSKIT